MMNASVTRALQSLRRNKSLLKSNLFYSQSLMKECGLVNGSTAFNVTNTSRSFSSSHDESSKPNKMKEIQHNYYDFIEHWSVKSFYVTGGMMTVGAGSVTLMYGICQESVIIDVITTLYWLIGFRDMNQQSHAILRNFPVLGHIRFLLEMVRPEMRQYLIESDDEGRPFNRLHRATAYQRAKNVKDTLPFGARLDVYVPGYMWALHSIYPAVVDRHTGGRVLIGGKDCTQKYSASILNISGMR